MSGLRAYKRSGQDPVYLGLLGLLGLYLLTGVILSVLKMVRMMIVLGGMLIAVRAWRNWKERRTDEALFGMILALMIGENTSDFHGNFPISHQSDETMDGRVEVLVRTLTMGVRPERL